MVQAVGAGVLVGCGVLVTDTGVLVAGSGVFVLVLVDGTGVLVGGTGVLVGGTGVLVKTAKPATLFAVTSESQSDPPPYSPLAGPTCLPGVPVAGMGGSGHSTKLPVRVPVN